MMRPFAILMLSIFAVCGTALAQYAQEDEPSLGDVARQSRQRHAALEVTKHATEKARQPDAALAATAARPLPPLKQVPLAVRTVSPAKTNLATMLAKVRPSVPTEAVAMDVQPFAVPKPIEIPVLHLPKAVYLPPIVQPALPEASRATAEAVQFAVARHALALPDPEVNLASPAGTILNPKIVEDDETEFMARARDLLRDQKFAELDRMAAAARKSKTRISGSTWQLTTFYMAVGQPRSGENIAPEEWTTHVARLQSWEKAMPQSVTAAVALAQTYVNITRITRMTHWSEFTNSARLAKVELSKIPALNEQCPHQYSVALQLATLDNWDKQTTSALFEEAFENEPEYYPYYRDYAAYLSPRWHGQPGELAEFANAIMPRLPGQQGTIVYFEIASVLACNCGEDNSLADLSWEKIKEGYASLELLYGSSLEERNHYLFMAAQQKDKRVAQQVAEEVKTNWNPTVWGARRFFEDARAWALRGGDEGQ
jgi:hypothetical protein